MSTIQSFDQPHRDTVHSHVSSTLSFSRIDDNSTTSGDASMQPLPSKRAKKASTLNAAAWAPHEDRVLELHITEGHSLKEVAQIMEDEVGFKAKQVERQYRTRISQWKKDKNIKPVEMRAIVRKRCYRDLMEKHKQPLHFEVRGRSITGEHIDRWAQRNHINLDSASCPDTETSTPSAVLCRTISNRSVLSPYSAASVGALSPAMTLDGPSESHLLPGSPSCSTIVDSPMTSFTSQSPAVVEFGSLESIMGVDTPSTIQELISDLLEDFNDPAVELLPTHDHESGTKQSMISRDPLRYIISTYSTVGYQAAKERQLVQEIKQYEAKGRQASEEHLLAMTDLGEILRAQARSNTSMAILKHSILIAQKNLTNPSRVVKWAALILGKVLTDQARYERAELILRKALRLDTDSTHQYDLKWQVITMANLASVLSSIGEDNYEASESISLQVIQKCTALAEDSWSRSIASMYVTQNLLHIYTRSQRFEEAEDIARPVVTMVRDQPQRFNWATACTVVQLCTMYRVQGRLTKIQELLEGMVTDLRKVFGAANEFTLEVSRQLATFHGYTGNLSEATNILRSVVDGLRANGGDQDLETIFAIGQLATNLARQGHYEEANELGEKAVRDTSKVLGPQHFETRDATADLGYIYYTQQRLQEASPLLRDAIFGSWRGPFYESVRLSRAIGSLIEICRLQERWDELERLQIMENNLPPSIKAW